MLRLFSIPFLFLFLLVGLARATAYAVDDFEFTMMHANYSGDAQIGEQEQQYTTFIPSIDLLHRFGSPNKSHHVIGADGFVILPLGYEDEVSVAFPELYYQYVFIPKKVKIGLGRIKQEWSLLDSHWNLGLWQPLVRWDAANPVEQGLTGVFVEAGSDMIRTVLMGTTVFLPDQQASYEERNGRIVSSNRWFRAPTDKAVLQNSTASIDYEVIEPDVQDVIQRSSFAGLVELGERESGFFVRGSYADKPANQFHLAIDTERILDITNSNFLTPIYPTVVRHRLVTGEGGYRWADATIIFSSTAEYYEKPEVPADWQQTALIDARYDGVIMSNTLAYFGLKRTNLSFSYVKRTEQEDSQKATLIKGDVEASTQRFQFEEMTGVGFTTNVLRTFRQQLDLHVKYVYSIIDAGEWLQAGVRYQYDRQWTFAFSGDVFGVEADQSASTSFISKYRGNDRVMGSMSYVF